MDGKNSITGAGIVFAQEDWKGDFETVCSKTQDAMTFSVDELKDLIVKCNKLKPLIEKLDESQRKVYLRRLQLCKDLFVLCSNQKKRNDHAPYKMLTLLTAACQDGISCNHPMEMPRGGDRQRRTRPEACCSSLNFPLFSSLY